ncbi:hypothetical protein D3C87_1857710 [compost metagenome]
MTELLQRAGEQRVGTGILLNFEQPVDGDERGGVVAAAEMLGRGLIADLGQHLLRIFVAAPSSSVGCRGLLAGDARNRSDFAIRRSLLETGVGWPEPEKRSLKLCLTYHPER